MLATLSQGDLQRIESADPATAAEWWKALSHYEQWPDELLPEENNRRAELMEAIEHRLSRKYILRHINPDMPEDQFEDFWNAHFGDRPAYMRWRVQANSK
jgi:hypothetical protein